MSKVYFQPSDQAGASRAARDLLARLLAEADVDLAPTVPLKVHFGEKGNHTFVPASCYDGLIDLLEERGVESAFIESNVLYGGARATRVGHTMLARDHGFTRLPILIADGEVGEDQIDVPVSGKHFRVCHVAGGIARAEQMIVCSHFKGHRIAGFGGALKQLGMGGASREGKLAQHQGGKPFIDPFRCKQCGACLTRCGEDAITLGRWSRIDHGKCVACLGCIAACRQGAIHVNWLRSLSPAFPERIAEYAVAAAGDKPHLYVTFALNITAGCDCEGRAMTPVTPDLGVLASEDPVAVDQACLDLLEEREGRRVFRRGRRILSHAQKLGLGSRAYELVVSSSADSPAAIPTAGSTSPNASP